MPIVPHGAKAPTSPIRKARRQQRKKGRKTDQPPYSTISHIDAYTIGFALSLRSPSTRAGKRIRRRKPSASGESDGAVEESESEEDERIDCENPACLRALDAYNEALENNLERKKAVQLLSQRFEEIQGSHAAAEANREQLKEMHCSLEADIRFAESEDKDLKATLQEVLQEKEELSRKLDAALKEKQRLRMQATGLMRSFQDPYADLEPVEIQFKPRLAACRQGKHKKSRPQSAGPRPSSFTVELDASDWRHPSSTNHQPRSCWNAIEGHLEGSQRLPPKGGFATKLRQEARLHRPKSALGLSRPATSGAPPTTGAANTHAVSRRNTGAPGQRAQHPPWCHGQPSSSKAAWDDGTNWQRKTSTPVGATASAAAAAAATSPGGARGKFMRPSASVGALPRSTPQAWRRKNEGSQRGASRARTRTQLDSGEAAKWQRDRAASKTRPTLGR